MIFFKCKKCGRDNFADDHRYKACNFCAFLLREGKTIEESEERYVLHCRKCQSTDNLIFEEQDDGTVNMYCAIHKMENNDTDNKMV